MKKIMVILACVAMLFSFASCDNSTSQPTNEYAVASKAFEEFATEFDNVTIATTDKVTLGDDNKTVTYETPFEGDMVTGTVKVTFAAKDAPSATTTTVTTGSAFSFVADLTVTGADFVPHYVTISGENGYTDAVVTITYDAKKGTSAAVTTASTKNVLPATINFSNVGTEDAEKIVSNATVTTLAAYKAMVDTLLENVATVMTDDGLTWTYAAAQTEPTATAANISATDSTSKLAFKVEGAKDGVFTPSKIILSATGASVSGVSGVTTVDLADVTVSTTGITFTCDTDGTSTVTAAKDATPSAAVSGGTATFSDNVVLAL